eukprot:15468449-Alexandrium_andersonii.AAC.1
MRLQSTVRPLHVCGAPAPTLREQYLVHDALIGCVWARRRRTGLCRAVTECLSRTVRDIGALATV